MSSLEKKRCNKIFSKIIIMKKKIYRYKNLKIDFIIIHAHLSQVNEIFISNGI